MHRRELLGVLTASVGVAGGCTGRTVTERPSGEIDIEFETRATQSYTIQLRLVDADGQMVEEFESAFPPDQSNGPSFYAGGLVNGPYTVNIETETDSTSFEWSVDNCQRLDVDVTVLSDGRLEYESVCSASESG